MKTAYLLKPALVLLVTMTSSIAFAQGATANQLYAQARQAKNAGEHDKAVELLKQVLVLSPDFAVGYYDLACTYALKGDKEKALSSLRDAVDKGYVYFERMKNDPDLKKLRSRKEFKAILADKDKYIRAAADKAMQHWKDKLGGSYKFERDDKYRLIIACEVPEASKQNIVNNLRLAAKSHGKNLFMKKPDYYISVVICRSSQSFVALLGQAYSRAAGVYVHAHKTLYVNSQSGIGTVTHEFTHALQWADALARKQDMQPQWIIEGFGTLYESPTFTKGGELKSHLSWTHHWRLPGLKTSIQNGTYAGWKNLFYNWATIPAAHAYQITKYIFLYLQEQGLLYRFYEEYVACYPARQTARSTTEAGIKAFEKVCGKKIAELEPEWKEWVLNLGKPMMGVYFDQNYTGAGARIEKVEPGSPAEAGGMKPGDIILEMDGHTVNDYTNNQELLKKKERGETAVFKVKRDEKELEVTVKLGVWPRK